MADIKKLIGFPESLIREAEKVMGPEENFAGWVRDSCRARLEADEADLGACTDLILEAIGDLKEEIKQ